MGRLYGIPVVITTSVESGPNGPLPKEILEMYPDAPYIARPGEVDAWDNPDFRAAVKATARKQMIVAGITTDVCVAQLALSLRAEGHPCGCKH
jgi:nicotinamidase-related amidase